MLDMGFKYFSPQRDVDVSVLPPDRGSLQGSGIHGKIVSQPLLPTLMGFFLIHPMCGSYSASFGLPPPSPRGNSSICRCSFDVSVGGGGFKVLLPHHLELEPIYFYIERYRKCIVKILIQVTKPH